MKISDILRLARKDPPYVGSRDQELKTSHLWLRRLVKRGQHALAKELAEALDNALLKGDYPQLESLIEEWKTRKEVRAFLEPVQAAGSTCSHYGGATKGCVPGCKKVDVARGNDCPWVDQWDDAEGECPCYK